MPARLVPLTLVLGVVAAPPVASAQEARPLSPRHLSLLLGPEPSPAGLGWTVSSPDDASWEGAVAPIATGHRTRAAALIPDGWPYPSVPEHEVFLELPEPMREGFTYVAEADDGVTSATLLLDPASVVSPAWRVNQIGYLPDAPLRYGYFSFWMGTLGPLALGDDERGFSVIDAETGEAVHSGTLALRRAAGAETPEDVYGQDFTGTNVYEADLSPVAEPGSYYVVLDGGGRSHGFDVAGDVYDAPFVTVFRALYQQRCGEALSAEHTAWSHDACHQHTVEWTDADYHVVGSDAFGALPAAATGETVDVAGGYHDAGDYDRRIGHLEVVEVLVDLWELDPVRFAWDAAGLPDSGDGVPDVLDEARFAIDLYRQLQTADGAVSAGVETTGYPPWGAMPEDDAPPEGGSWTWYAYAPDPISTMSFASAAARLARALEPFDAAGAEALLEEAERAWNRAWADGPRPEYGEGPRLEYDQRAAAAAAALLAATGEASYDAAFAQVGPFAGGLGFSLADWDNGGWIPALWTYARAEAASPDVADAAVRVIEERADAWLEYADAVAFRIAKHPYAPIGWSTASTPTAEGAGLLLRAHALTGRDELRGWAITTCDLTLGANPSGWSFVTGLGERPVQQPLHNPSMGDGIEAPVPGLTVFGPMDDEESGGILGSVIAAYDPPVQDWPQLERFADVGYAPPINEFTTHPSSAPTVFAFGYLAALEGGGAGPGDDDDDDDDGVRGLGDDGAGDGCGCAAAVAPGGSAGLLAVLVLSARRRRAQTLV